MKNLHFGAGNIGRGFIGKLLSEAGLEVTFADVVPDLINALAARKTFSVNVVGEGGLRVDHVKVAGAVFSNSEDVLPQIVGADLITTAVGPRILERIAPTLAKGLEQRMLQGVEKPVNIIACENAIRASTTLKEFALKDANEDFIKWTETHVAFVDCAVDRIVPPARHEDPLEVTVEDFCEWVVDQTQLIGELPAAPEIHFTEHLMAFVERKLMTVNTGHAICAYLGKLYSHKYISEAIRDPRIRPVVEGAMRESGAVLVRRYKMDPAAHENYIQKIIKRYSNPHIVDDVTRVGRDPIRKLGPEDRLIKPISGCLEFGIPHTNLIKGVTAALLYSDPEDAQSMKIQQMVSEIGWEGVLKDLCGLGSEVGAKFGSDVRLAISEFGGIAQV